MTTGPSSAGLGLTAKMALRNTGAARDVLGSLPNMSARSRLLELADCGAVRHFQVLGGLWQKLRPDSGGDALENRGRNIACYLPQVLFAQ